MSESTTSPPTPSPPSRSGQRARIVDVAARLLAEHGVDAVTTRGVALAAGVQAPTLYRLFGDKDGLLDAVAEHTMATYVSGKSLGPEDADPVAALRAGWDQHLAFSLANAALFVLLADPGRAARFPAAAAGTAVLAARVRRVAQAGRLRVAERRAVDLIHAAGTGAVLTLLADRPEDRDPHLADAVYDAVAAAILTDPPPTTAGSDPTTAAVLAVRASAEDLPALSAGERTVLAEWLDRVAAHG